MQNLFYMSVKNEEGKKGIRFNPTFDIGHIITTFSVVGMMVAGYASYTRQAVNQENRIAAVERASFEQKVVLQELVKTLTVLGENQAKLSLKLDLQIERTIEDRADIKDLERTTRK